MGYLTKVNIQKSSEIDKSGDDSIYNKDILNIFRLTKYEKRFVKMALTMRLIMLTAIFLVAQLGVDNHDWERLTPLALMGIHPD